MGLDEEQRQSKFNTYEPNKELKDRPEISQKTAKLASIKRAKLLEGKDASQVKSVDIFLIPKVDQTKIEAKKKQLEDREVQDCTFAPKTLNYKGSTKNGVTHGDRCMDLYAKKPKGWFREKGEKTHDDYEYEKSKDELKFKPTINDPENI